MDSKTTANIFRGLAILLIVAVRFADRYAPLFHDRWLVEYGAVVVAVFFVLSGYDTWRSLTERFTRSGSSLRAVAAFAADRALMIYPLYWLSLLTLSILMPADFRHLFDFSADSVAIWLASPFVRFDYLWFVSAIVQCYWAAIPLFLIIRKLGSRLSLGLVALMVLTALLISVMISLNRFDFAHLPALGQPMSFFYRNFFLGNIVLFVIGMLAASAASGLERAARGRTNMAAGFAIFLILGYMVRTPNLLFERSELAMMPFFFAATAFLCLAAEANAVDWRILRPLDYMGKRAFAIYLLHSQFLILLSSRLTLAADTMMVPLAGLAVLPFLVLFCTAPDHLANHVVRYVRTLRERKEASRGIAEPWASPAGDLLIYSRRRDALGKPLRQDL